MDNNNKKFLSYNEWDGDYHKGFSIDHKGLAPNEIQNAIDDYINSQNKLVQENLRLVKLLDDILVEYNVLKKFRDDYMDERNSGY